MSDSKQALKEEFRDRKYREAYAGDFLNTFIATQISVLREQRRLTQWQLGEMAGMKQEAISRVENVDYGRWNIATLKRIASALDARLRVSVETYGSLLDEAEAFSADDLRRPSFEEDLVFQAAKRPAVEDAGLEDAMRRRLVAWLDAPERKPNQLIEWLQGRNLPAFDKRDEPYLYIWRAVPPGAERRKYHPLLSRSVRDLLLQQPDQTRPGRRPEDLLRNLYQLAAAVEMPQILGEPLQTLFFERAKPNPDRFSRDIRESLHAALVWNQHNEKMADEWFTMIHGRSHPVFPGNEYSGWEGVKRLPPPPNMRSIGKALKSWEEHWYKREDRIDRFAGVLGQVFDSYPHRINLAGEFLEQAHASRWSLWAVAAWSGIVLRNPDIASELVRGKSKAEEMMILDILAKGQAQAQQEKAAVAALNSVVRTPGVSSPLR